jgi:hypothetical protein
MRKSRCLPGGSLRRPFEVVAAVGEIAPAPESELADVPCINCGSMVNLKVLHSRWSVSVITAIGAAGFRSYLREAPDANISCP